MTGNDEPPSVSTKTSPSNYPNNPDRYIAHVILTLMLTLVALGRHVCMYVCICMRMSTNRSKILSDVQKTNQLKKQVAKMKKDITTREALVNSTE